MKDYEKLLISIANDFTGDHGLEALFEELFPGMSPGELVRDMYEAGLIPDDVMETFLGE